MAGNIVDSQSVLEVAALTSYNNVTTQTALEVGTTSTFATQITQAVSEVSVTRTFRVIASQVVLEVCVITCASTSYVPPAPTGVITLTAASAGINTHAINLSWTPDLLGFTYTVERGETSGGPYTTIASELTTTSYEDTGLTYGQPYYYVVIAEDSCGNITTTNEADATPDCTRPDNPIGLTVNLASGGVFLFWDASPECTYSVYRSLLPGQETDTPIASGLADPVYLDPWTQAGLVFYKVSALNECGPSGLSAEGQILVPLITSIPPCKNGFYVVNETQVRLRESQSTTAQQQSMLYLEHVRRTLDEVGRRTYTIFDTACTDIIAGQPEYVMPHRPFDLRSVSINDRNGNVYEIAGLTVEQANQKFANWQNMSIGLPLWSGLPTHFIFEGNRFWLIPTPNYSVQNGIIIHGYYGVDQWYELDMCLPFPEGFVEVMILGTTLRRCEEMEPQDPLYTQAYNRYQPRYEELIRRHYRERINATEASRSTIPSKGKRISAWAGAWFWMGS